MSRGIIFDLDQTLIDSSALEILRNARKWNDVYSRIPSIGLYPGIIELLAYLKKEEIPIGIVTNSPSIYCQKVINHFQFPVKTIICYHDVKQRKPHPEPILKALQQLNLKSSRNVFSIGDRLDDLIASKASGISTIGAIWGSSEVEQIKKFNPDFIATEPKQLITMLQDYWSKNS